MEEESRLMIVPADAVIQRRRVLFIRTRCKGQVGGDRSVFTESESRETREGERNPVPGV